MRSPPFSLPRFISHYRFHSHSTLPTTTRTLHLRLRNITTTPRSPQNSVYIPIRSTDEFSTLLLLPTLSQRPLITLWTASYCSSCRVIAPLIRDAIEKERMGESEGGVGFVEVEVDAPGMGGLGMEYLASRSQSNHPEDPLINSIPTLLSFSRQEAQLMTKVTSVDKMKDREFLRLWIENEARRRGAGGAGGGGKGLLGSMFGFGQK